MFIKKLFVDTHGKIIPGTPLEENAAKCPE